MLKTENIGYMLTMLFILFMDFLPMEEPFALIRPIIPVLMVQDLIAVFTHLLFTAKKLVKVLHFVGC